MADTNKITYVSLENLNYYDEKIKGYIDGADAVVQAAVDAEVTRAKAAEATNAVAASDAQAAADKAQGEVDALETYVGTIPETAEATNIVAYVQEKTAGIATNTALEELTGRVAQAETDIDAIEKDYLKAADKTELNGLIEAAQAAADAAQSDVDELAETHSTDKAALVAEDARIEGLVTAEVSARESADSAIDARLVKVETFFETAEGETLDTALDTLVELQKYLTDEGSVADQMLLDIAANTKAIEDEATARANADTALSGRLDTLEAIDHDAYIAADSALETKLNNSIALKADASALESAVETLEGVDEGFETRIAALEAKHGDGEGTVESLIAAAKQEAIDSAVATAAADATSKADAAEADAIAYANSLNTAMATRMDTVEAKAHEHSNKALLDTYTQTEVNLADAVAKKHEHSNFDILEAITAAKVAAWDAAEANAKAYAKEYADGLNTAMGARMVTVEEWQANMVEAEESDIDALFA